MMGAFRELDRVLRGEAVLGTSGLAVAVGPLVRGNALLAILYGVCMGVFGLFREGDPEYRQVIASAFKVPLLFVLTLIVTFPSLYVFNTLLGSRLRFGELLRLVVSGLSVLLAVLAAFGPIVAFFSVTTTSYPFILLLNVAVFTVSGLFGMGFLMKALTRMRQLRSLPLARPVGGEQPTEGEAVEPDLDEDEEAPRRRDRRGPPPAEGGGNGVIYAWMVVFGLVGAQMGWVLRPFVGSPDLPFTWFRPREASFFEGVLRSLKALFGG